MDGTTGAGVATMVTEDIMDGDGTTHGDGTTGAGVAIMAGTTLGDGTTGAGEATMVTEDIMDGAGTTHGDGTDGIDGDGPEIMVGEVIMVTYTTEITEGTMHTPTIVQDVVTTIQITMALRL
ncbi:hypothetical protein CJ263_02815 [Maribacter cobaltidurans]|uniref:Uncharacterized protein n=1 Tax=Maribacter cobaltidurans TaxID=1178778 RepID=A0A223V281_9FLAO|nr:hypothetical protein CJ263_02815 [Maribacter cobaltidurans]